MYTNTTVLLFTLWIVLTVKMITCVFFIKSNSILFIDTVISSLLINFINESDSLKKTIKMQSKPNENDQVILLRQQYEKFKSTNINSLFSRFSPLIHKDSQHRNYNGLPVFNNRPITRKRRAKKINRKTINNLRKEAKKIWAQEKTDR